MSLFRYLLIKRDKKVESVEPRIENNAHVVYVKIEGNNNTINLPKPVYELSKSIKAVESLKHVVSPVKLENGITDATFIVNKKEQLKVDQEAASNLQLAHADAAEEPQIFTAHAVVHAPVLDVKAKQWKFKLAGHVVPIDISETNIAREVLQRGEVFVGDTYKLKIEMIERKRSNGAYVSEYKAKEVLEFIQGNTSHPMDLPFTQPSPPPDKSKP